jgi:hypothetical protein
MPDRLQMARRALLYTGFNLALLLGLGLAGITPLLLALPYAVQFAETVWGGLASPAVGVKPTRIGVRQLIVSTLFTILFIIAWTL